MIRLPHTQYVLNFINLMLSIVIAFTSCTLAYAKGGDAIAPFPVSESQAGKQEAMAMAVDSAGNIIVAGYHNNGGMNNNYQVVKFKADGSGVAWPAVTYDNSGGDDTAMAVAVDGNGDIIVTGYSWNGSNYDIHTIKYNGASGAVLWQHTFAGAAGGGDYATTIAVDSSDDIYVAGYTANASGNDDYLILKYPSAGDTPTWTVIHDDATYHNQDRITSITAGSNGIAVTGYSSKGGVDFDILTRKYGFDGSFIREWRKSSSGSLNDRGAAVKMDSSGDPIITGYLSNTSNTDIYTARYNAATGDVAWEKTYDGGYNDEPRGLWVDDAGNAYVTGYTFTLNGQEDFYTVRYNAADGTKAWDAIFHSGGEDHDIPVGIIVSNPADGGVFVTGYTVTEVNDNFTTLKYKKDTGVLLWERTFNGSANRNDRPVGIGMASLAVASDVRVAGWSDTAANSYDFLAMTYDHGPLNAPTSLVATATSNTAVSLTWTDNSANEDGFKIERKLGATGVYSQIDTVAAGVISYADSGLTANSYYYYRVRANNAANGDSDFSNESHVLTKVVSYDAPTWSYLYNGADNREDAATAITVDSDDHPVVTGYSELQEEGVAGTYSHDYITIKLNRDDKSIKWKARYDSGDGGTDMAAGVALDSDGDAIVTGTAYLMGGGDKSDDLFTIKFNTAGYADPVNNPPMIWSHQYGTEQGIDLATAVMSARDGSDHSAVIGYGMNASMNYDIFLIKYNADGSRPWTPVVYDGNLDDLPTAVAFDPSGNLFMTGYSKNPSGDYDWYTARYNGASGARFWFKTYAGAGNGDDLTKALAVDASGNVYVTGYAVNAADDEEMVTIKYSGTDGTVIWTAVHNGIAAPVNGNDQGIAIGIDPIDGAIVVAGTSYVSTTDSDFHIIRYNSADGSIIWERNFDRPTTYDYVTAMTIDSSGYIYVTGNVRNGLDIDTDFDGTSNIMSLMYDFEGTFLGAMSYDGTGREDKAIAITTNFQGEAFVAGFARNATNPDYVVLKQKNNYILVPAPLTLVPQADASKMNVTWRQNSPGTSFRVERTIGPALPDSTWSLVTTAPSGTTNHIDTGLSPGTYYCYRIYAFSGSLSSRTIQSCGTTTLAAPTLAALSVDSTTQITLNWNNISNNTGYKIERKIGAGTWADLTTKTADVTTHIDTGLTPGTNYYYRVSSNSTSGYSLPSNEQAAPTKPIAPTLNAPTSITNTQMAMGWNAVTGAANYTLQYKLAGGSYANFAGCTAIAGTSCTVTGLTAPNTYNFRVKATNTGGDSAWSNETTGTAALAVPTLTTPIATATITSSTMVVAWTNPVVTGANLTSYTLEYKEGAGSYVTGCTTANGTTLNCNVTGLTPNRTYTFHVRANNASGSSNWSGEVSAKTLLLTPTLDSATRVSTTRIDLAWTGVAEATGYTIQQADCKNNASNPASCDGTTDANYNAWADKATNQPGPSYSVTTGLSAGNNYRYRIIATVAGNTSAVSTIKHSWTDLTTPTLTVIPASSTSLSLSWDTQPGETNYTVEKSTTGIGGPYTAIPAATGLAINTGTYTDASLSLATEYCYQIKAYSSVANPPPAVYSTPKCKTTPPIEPTQNAPTIASSTQINLSWSQVATNTGYEIERCITTDNNEPVTHPLGACTNLTPTITQDTTSFNNTGLTAGNSYRYRVRALYNGSADYTAWSTAAYWVTTTPPTPTMVAPTAATTTTTQLTPTWNNVAGDNGYKLYWKARSGASCTDDSWNGPIALGKNITTYNHAGRTPGTFYCYKISAIGPSGPPVTPDSAFSNIVEQSTKPNAPGVITFSGISTSSITLSWPQVSGNSGYRIERSINNSTWPDAWTVLTDVTTFTNNSGLSPGTLYYYRVSANSSGGYSAVSAVQSTTTTPLAPSVTTAVISAAEIDLSWPVVVGATNYKIERKEGAGAYSEIANLAVAYAQKYCGYDNPTFACPALTPISTGYQSTGLAENTAYCYKLKAWNASGGDSVYSTEKCATTSAMASQNLTATAINAFKVRLDWSPIVCTPNPCDNPDGFEIERQMREGIWVNIATVAGTLFTYTDTISIDPGRRYRFRVRAYKSTDFSPYTEATVITPKYLTGDETCP